VPGWLRPRSRRSALLVAVALGALAIPAVAFATVYWGFNYMGLNTSGACYYNMSGHIACANVAADSDQVDKAGGASDGYIVNSFEDGGKAHVFNQYITDTISAFDSTGHDPAQGPSCFYFAGGRSYIQCRYFNGFSPVGGTSYSPIGGP
jgi:hypothetical protein